MTFRIVPGSPTIHQGTPNAGVLGHRITGVSSSGPKGLEPRFLILRMANPESIPGLTLPDRRWKGGFRQDRRNSRSNELA